MTSKTAFEMTKKAESSKQLTQTTEWWYSPTSTIKQQTLELRMQTTASPAGLMISAMYKPNL